MKLQEKTFLNGCSTKDQHHPTKRSRLRDLKGIPTQFANTQRQVNYLVAVPRISIGANVNTPKLLLKTKLWLSGGIGIHTRLKILRS